MKKCKVCKSLFKPKYNSVQMFCSFKCGNDYKKSKPVNLKLKSPINKISSKQDKLNKIYLKKRKIFLSKLKSIYCPITNELITDIHHKKGRIGYADDYARLNEIPLLLDERFWVALSRSGHRFVEDNPEWAKINNYSIDRNK